MAKGPLLLAVIGLMCLMAFSCPVKPYYSCVHSHKPKYCTAIQVCERPKKELCGKYHCEYPHTCASIKKSVCKDFYSLKQKCEYRKACKEVKIPCGSGACKITHDCVKENHCYLGKIPVSRRLMGDFYGKAGSYGGKSEGYIDVVKPYKKEYVCEDKYSCVEKDPCKDIIIKKCVKDVLKPGIDYCHGGFDFYWYGVHATEKCGTEYCGAGSKCAEVIIKKCVKPCGDHYCNYGEECVAYGEECKDYAYLAKICKDVYEPTCIPLTPYLKLYYKPPCKTVFKCEEDPAECGGKYCPKGYTCEVSYKKTCGVVYKPTIISKPIVIQTKSKEVYHIVGVPYSAFYSGAHTGAQSSGKDRHPGSDATSPTSTHSGRRLDFYPDGGGDGSSSGHSYGAGRISSADNSDSTPSDITINAFGEAAGATYVFGDGQGETLSNVVATAEQKPDGSRTVTVSVISESTVKATNSGPQGSSFESVPRLFTFFP